MSNKFFATIATLTLLALTGCPYNGWEVVYECDSDQCQTIEAAFEAAQASEPEAQTMFEQGLSGQVPFTVQDTINAAEDGLISCGSPYNNRVSEHVFTDVFPAEIIINDYVFDLDTSDDEDRIVCSLAATLVHAGGHLVAPEIKHGCEVPVEDLEACPPDKLTMDPIHLVDDTVHLACAGL